MKSNITRLNISHLGYFLSTLYLRLSISMKRLFNSIGNESSLVFFFTYIFTLDALGLCVSFSLLYVFRVVSAP